MKIFKLSILSLALSSGVILAQDFEQEAAPENQPATADLTPAQEEALSDALNEALLPEDEAAQEELAVDISFEPLTEADIVVATTRSELLEAQRLFLNATKSLKSLLEKAETLQEGSEEWTRNQEQIEMIQALGESIEDALAMALAGEDPMVALGHAQIFFEMSPSGVRYYAKKKPFNAGGIFQGSLGLVGAMTQDVLTGDKAYKFGLIGMVGAGLSGSLGGAGNTEKDGNRNIAIAVGFTDLDASALEARKTSVSDVMGHYLAVGFELNKLPFISFISEADIGGGVDGFVKIPSGKKFVETVKGNGWEVWKNYSAFETRGAYGFVGQSRGGHGIEVKTKYLYSGLVGFDKLFSLFGALSDEAAKKEAEAAAQEEGLEEVAPEPVNAPQEEQEEDNQ